jgi:hypothetical protein
MPEGAVWGSIWRSIWGSVWIPGAEGTGVAGHVYSGVFGSGVFGVAGGAALKLDAFEEEAGVLFDGGCVAELDAAVGADDTVPG